MRIEPAQAAEYRRRHDAIWPELASLLRTAGILDYRIFLDGETGDLFAVMTRAAGHTLDALAQEPVMRRWWTMMADLMPTGPDGAPPSRPLEPVFHLTAESP
jgi:L-rhamnose mutarotase